LSYLTSLTDKTVDTKSLLKTK